MDKQFYLDLAHRGVRMPIATHLVLHEHPDPEAILLDGERLARVMVDTAERFGLPLALPVMDLTLEKDLLLHHLGVPPEQRAGYHFRQPPAPALAGRIGPGMDLRVSPRIQANCRALSSIRAAGQKLPVGMSIGPFSLLTKLLQDPITPLYEAGLGTSPRDDEDVALLHTLLGLAETVVQATCAAQIQAGARAIFLCEPAANLVFFSPNQVRENPAVFDTFVIEPNRRLKAMLDAHDTDLLFHDCGALIPEMVQALGRLEPRLISFGSPVRLWEVEPFVPRDVVLFGNLPTKKFYSDAEVPLGEVAALVAEIEDRLRPSGHPFIIGSECDVLSVPGYESGILAKVQAMCGQHP